MTATLTGFLVAVFLPLFVSSWRVAFLGLSLQGLCIALMSLKRGPLLERNALLQLLDLLCLRFVAVPVLFFWLLRKARPDRRLDLVPANLVTWILAVGLLILAFSLGNRLYPDELVLKFRVGAVASSILVGLFILSVQDEALGQMIGLLYLESGITLFETLGHREPWFIQILISLVFLWLLVLMGRFVRKLSLTEARGNAAALDPEVL